MSVTSQPLPNVQVREPAIVNLSPAPKCYEFLKAPTPPEKYRIKFWHPSYNTPLFTLEAYDHADGGIHHGLAHSACSIFAENRTDGYLSTTRDGEHGKRVQAGWDAVLPAAAANYYFYVPYPPDFPDPPAGQSRPPYRYPLVTNFQEWRFQGLPEVWTRCKSIQHAAQTIQPQSTITSAMIARDQTCRVTAFQSGTEVAHLVPSHEKDWFFSNQMGTYNTDQTLDTNNLLRDLKNGMLLRSDIHSAFDTREFIFFPKSTKAFVVHMLVPTPEIGQLYHNTRVEISKCGIEFLFARFAWALFPFLSVFLGGVSESLLVVRWNADGKRIVEDVTDPRSLRQQSAASRSTYQKKRSRATAEDLNDYGESEESPSDFTLPTSGDDSDSKKRFGKRRCKSLNYSMYAQEVHINELRQAALAKQRPVGYNPQPTGIAK